MFLPYMKCAYVLSLSLLAVSLQRGKRKRAGRRWKVRLIVTVLRMNRKGRCSRKRGH